MELSNVFAISQEIMPVTYNDGISTMCQTVFVYRPNCLIVYFNYVTPLMVQHLKKILGLMESQTLQNAIYDKIGQFL